MVIHLVICLELYHFSVNHQSDTTANGGEGQFDTIRLDREANRHFKYRGSAVVGDKVYFAPYCAGAVGVVDTSANEGASAFHVLSMEDKVSGDDLFAGAAVVGNKVYFAPNRANCIGVLEQTTVLT